METEQDQMMQKRLKEMMDFFEFSIRPNADFTGAISFCLATDSNKTYSFTIRILDDNGDKIAVAKLGIERPTTVVTMSASDFFYVYSGEASAYEVTKMIIRRRINVENYEIHRVNSFAQSFDYSSSTWKAYYQYVAESNKFKQSIRTFISIPSYSSTFIQLRNFSSPFPLINYPSFSSSFLHDYPSFPRASFPLWRPTSVYLDLNEDDFRIDKKPVEEPSFVSEETYWYIQQQMMKPASITRHEKKRPSIFKLLFKPLYGSDSDLLFQMQMGIEDCLYHNLSTCQFSPLHDILPFQIVKSIKTYYQRINNKVKN